MKKSRHSTIPSLFILCLAGFSTLFFSESVYAECIPSDNQVAFYQHPDYRGACATKNIGDYFNSASLGIPNDKMSSVRVGQNVQVELCRDAGYQGTCELFAHDDPRLKGNAIGDNTVTSARVQAKGSVACAPSDTQVAFYQHPDYRGTCVTKNIGEYSNSASLGIPNDKMSSVRVGRSLQVELCRHAGYGGTCELFAQDDPRLKDNAIGDNTVTSARVQAKGAVACAPGDNQVSFYSHPQFLGECIIRDIGKYPDHNTIGIPKNTMSAVRVGRNIEVILCRNANYGWPCEILTHHHSNLRNTTVGDNGVRSARVKMKQPLFCPSRNKSGDQGELLAVMSFNIFHDKGDTAKNIPKWEWERKNLIREVIETYSPDVIGLQEAYIDQVQGLLSELPTYGYIGAGRANGASKGESVSILYQKGCFEPDESGHFWFSDTPDVPSKGKEGWGSIKDPRMTTWVRLRQKSTGKGFYVYNTHLNHNKGAEHPEYARMRSVQLLTERIAARSHPENEYIITGDFNATDQTEPIGYMKGGRVCLPLHAQPCIYSRSPIQAIDAFQEGNPTNPIVSRVDYIFVSNGIPDTRSNSALCQVPGCGNPEVLEAKIIGAIEGFRPSDHDAIFSIIRFPGFGQTN